MKKLLLLKAVLCCLSISALAQPTLSSSGVSPVIGDVFTFINCGTVSEGSSGANQTWDLSSMSQISTSTCSTVPVSNSPYASSFASSSYALTSNDTAFVFYTSNTSSYQLSGIADHSSPYSYIFSDKEDVLRFPLTYNDAYSDSYASTNNDTANQMITYQTGGISVEADGYGTLILPNGTYTNVLRVRTEDIQIDSVYSTAGGGFLFAYGFDNVTYSWYLNGNHQPIAQVQYSTGINPFSNYLSNIIGIKENIDNSDLFTTFPSPANTQLTIDTKGTRTFEAAEITSASGSKLMNVTLDNSNGSYTIDVSSLAAGIYFIELKSKEGISARRKFVVTH